MNATNLLLALIASPVVRLVASQDDWIQLARLTLANYALTKADGAPPDVVCSKKGSKPKSCHCWSFNGKPGQEDNYCDSPTGCLIYSTKDDGNLSYAKLNSSDDVHKVLASWSVPPKMSKNFDLAMLTDNSTFTTFDFTVEPDVGKYEAHVGTARLHEGKRFIGYTYGRSNASLIEPMIRKTKPGDCHGQNEKHRGFTTEEIEKIRAGLASQAFKTAARKAQALADPQLLPQSLDAPEEVIV